MKAAIVQTPAQKQSQRRMQIIQEYLIRVMEAGDLSSLKHVERTLRSTLREQLFRSPHDTFLAVRATAIRWSCRHSSGTTNTSARCQATVTTSPEASYGRCWRASRLFSPNKTASPRLATNARSRGTSLEIAPNEEVLIVLYSPPFKMRYTFGGHGLEGSVHPQRQSQMQLFVKVRVFCHM